MIAGGAIGGAAIAAAGPLPRAPAGQLRPRPGGGAAAPEREAATRIAGETRAAAAPRP